MDVFVSYKREDRDRIAPAVAALEASGLSVWWDASISGGDHWRADIARMLGSARCVIVIWTANSVSHAGDFVHDEARRAKARGVLLPVLLDDVEPPVGFGELQTVDMRGWRGAPGDPRLALLIAEVRARITRGPRAPARARVARLARGLAPWAAPVAVVAGIAAFAANLWSLQTPVCAVPGLAGLCAQHGLGGQATPEEQALWDGRVAGDCDALRSVVTDFPKGRYHAEAAQRLAAVRELSVESWVPAERRLPLTVRAPLTGSSDERTAREAALGSSHEDVALICSPYGELDGHRLTGMRAEPTRWRCQPSDRGQICAFDGYAICRVEVRATTVVEQCP